jgi:hypothetical protein
MERAGRPRHRLHNPRGEGESAGGDRINPSVGGSVLCPLVVSGPVVCPLVVSGPVVQWSSGSQLSCGPVVSRVVLNLLFAKCVDLFGQRERL